MGLPLPEKRPSWREKCKEKGHISSMALWEEP